MEWHFEQHGKAVGPVSDSQLDELMRTGVLSDATLVWHAGLKGWQPYGSLRSGATTPLPGAPALPGQPIQGCAECGRAFPREEMLFVSNTWICAQCKPVFIQKLKEGVEGGGLSIWRQGRTLVTRREAVLPDRCVKCNAPANGNKLRRNLSWHHPAYYLFVLLNLLIYVIVALIVRKQAKISVGLCESHRSRRARAIATAWSVVLAGAGLIVAAILYEKSWPALIGILLLLAGAIYGSVRGRIVTARRIDDKHVWLNGVCSQYLDTLPEWLG